MPNQQLPAPTDKSYMDIIKQLVAKVSSGRAADFLIDMMETVMRLGLDLSLIHI